MFEKEYQEKLKGMNNKELDEEIRASREQCIQMGLLEASGRDLRGEVVYRQSARGRRIVNELKAIE